ncbi:bZIP transcription factor [Fibrella sp. HMF5405]|uniref:BZIP transcription factor n=1 Tax=Fibrella forsythiae TaxID=2817061 RepID=A0ABS3JKV3_9BACT|nr:bZIP transcription factor [Fibrella forsythiae]
MGQNTIFGYQAGSNNTAFGNTFIGALTGQANTVGENNTFLGNNAGKSNTTGTFNLFVGSNAGQANTIGQENLFFGAGSGFTNTSGRFNTFVGLNSGFGNVGGENNVFIGQRAGFSNNTGSFNLFMGSSTGYTNQSGVYNTFVGNGAGYANQIGNRNTFLGLNSGFRTVESDNVSVGYNAGLENTTGFQNTFIGTNAGVSSANPNLQNATAIGYGTLVAASNSVILGNGARVGIGTSAPQNKLDLVSSVANTSGLRLTNLRSNSPATVLNTTKFLTVDVNGDVVLGSINGSARISPGLWEAAGMFIQNSNAGGVLIGSGINQTPAGYKLYVAEGILTEKVKVAVKNTSDWSDKVFEAGYDLKSLPEVADYIRVNRHLPGVLSAAQMVAQGNDLHKTDAKLLEKIEELTLYLLQQQSALQVMRRENKRMQTQTRTMQQQIQQLLLNRTNK